MSDEILMELQRAVGNIEGKLTGIEDKVDGVSSGIQGLDKRMRTIEIKAAGNGAAAGTLMAIGVEFVKQKLGM